MIVILLMVRSKENWVMCKLLKKETMVMQKSPFYRGPDIHVLFSIMHVAVPDSIVLTILRERLAQLDCVSRGWVLHGYPVTREQAEQLDRTGFTPNRYSLIWPYSSWSTELLWVALLVWMLRASKAYLVSVLSHHDSPRIEGMRTTCRWSWVFAPALSWLNIPTW